MPRTRKSHSPSLKAKVAVEAIKAHQTAAQIAQQEAMTAEGLNAPSLASKIRVLLRSKGHTKAKVDRSTIYRILSGETISPDPLIWHALVEILRLSPTECVRGSVRKARVREEDSAD